VADVRPQYAPAAFTIFSPQTGPWSADRRFWLLRLPWPGLRFFPGRTLPCRAAGLGNCAPHGQPRATRCPRFCPGLTAIDPFLEQSPNRREDADTAHTRVHPRIHVKTKGRSGPEARSTAGRPRATRLAADSERRHRRAPAPGLLAFASGPQLRPPAFSPNPPIALGKMAIIRRRSVV